MKDGQHLEPATNLMSDLKVCAKDKIDKGGSCLPWRSWPYW